MNAASRAKGGSQITRPRDEAKLVFRRAILEAAEHELGERGFHAARMQDIAKRAGLAVGTLYNHFAQKDDILRALLETRSVELLEELRPLPGDPDRFDRQLLVRLQRLLGFLERHRDFYALALDHGLLHASERSSESKLKNASPRARGALRDLVRAGVEAEVLDDLPFDLLVNFLGACIRAAVFGVLRDRKVRLAERAPLVARLFLHGTLKSKRP
jgi:AcrR family transcriptional regulator